MKTRRGKSKKTNHASKDQFKEFSSTFLEGLVEITEELALELHRKGHGPVKDILELKEQGFKWNPSRQSFSMVEFELP